MIMFVEGTITHTIFMYKPKNNDYVSINRYILGRKNIKVET